MRKTISILLICLMALSAGPLWATTTIARVKTWTSEKLYAADLNAELQNIIDYLNNNIAWVTNVTATATEINQLHVNRFANAYTFAATVTDSAAEVMNVGFVYTNNGRALLDSLQADTLISRSSGTQLGGSFFAVPLTDLTTYFGTPAKRVRSFTADTGRVQVATIDSLTGNTISDSWTLTPKTNSTGRLGSLSKHFQSVNGDTSAFSTGVWTAVAPLGFGIKPSAWGAGFSGFQGRSMAMLDDGSAGIDFVNNAYYDGANWKRIITSAVSKISQTADGKTHINWGTAGGNGGTTLFTQIAEFDTTGRVGVGTGVPGAQFDVNSGASYSRVNAGDALWTSSSDSTLKKNIIPVNPEAIDILKLLRSLPISNYNWKSGNPLNRIGPMAQDWYPIGKALGSQTDSTAIDWQFFMVAQMLAVKQLDYHNQGLRAWNLKLQTSLDSLNADYNSTKNKLQVLLPGFK